MSRERAPPADGGLGAALPLNVATCPGKGIPGCVRGVVPLIACVVLGEAIRALIDELLSWRRLDAAELLSPP